MNISEIIIARMKSFGLPKARVAGLIGTTPSQFGRFLDGKASLTRESMNKCFEALDIDLMIYKRRDDLAKEIAVILKSKKIDDISELTKDDIIALTGKKELSVFAEVNKEQFEEIKASVYVDVESTYNYMKELITHYLNSRDVNKITFSEAARIMETSIKKNKSKDKDKRTEEKKIIKVNEVPFTAKTMKHPNDGRFDTSGDDDSDWGQTSYEDVNEHYDDLDGDGRMLEHYASYEEDIVDYDGFYDDKEWDDYDSCEDVDYEEVGYDEWDEDDGNDFDDEVGIFSLINKFRKK